MEAMKKRLEIIQSEIHKAAMQVDRMARDIQIMAVSKDQNIQNMMDAYHLGICLFGENRMQEYRNKAAFMPTDTIWHYIGHLQKNNIRHIIKNITMVHSVDSLELAKELDKQARCRKKKLPFLMQVNIAKEASKFGFTPEESIKMAVQLSAFEHLQLKGLMTVAPFVKNPEDNRIHYRNLRNLLIDISTELGKDGDMEHLSMGMSGDYQVAVEEGATIVRIGTGLFGSRQYT